MIETLPARALVSNAAPPADVLAGFAAFKKSLLGRSLIVWGEHCSECAYPDCYSRCAFYTPRADLHCRRFERGIEPLADYPGLHHVRFRQWGKLEGAGPAPTKTAAAAARLEQRDERLSQWIATVPAPFQIKRHAAWRWNRSKGGRRSALRSIEPDGFVVEAWSADGRTHPFTLTILNTAAASEGRNRLFQMRFNTGPDYRRVLAPLAAITAQVDLQAPFLVQIEPVGDAADVSVVFGVCDFVAVEGGLAREPPLGTSTAPFEGLANVPPVKVVVWDLDDTLWSGVLAEVGVEGVELRRSSLAALRFLDERGVLQTIASKNDQDEALAALAALDVSRYFLHPQIHWGPKSASLAAQAAAFDLSLESFVFIDDQAFERAEVVTAHPAVRVLEPDALGALESHPWFDHPVTEESRKRRSLYLQEAARLEAFNTGADDYDGFLRSARLRLSVRPLAEVDIDRAFELSQRTNQLNFTGQKFSRDALRALVDDGDRPRAFTLRCADRFGDYGLIGLVVFDARAGVVSEVFLSCRIQRKRVENALFSWLCGLARAEGRSILSVAHAPTARNRAASSLLEGLGFTPTDCERRTWVRPVERAFEGDDIVLLDGHVLAPAV